MLREEERIEPVYAAFVGLSQIIEGGYSLRGEFVDVLEDDVRVGAIGQWQADGRGARDATVVAHGEITIHAEGGLRVVHRR